MKKGKLFAPFLMLLACAVASIVMYISNYSMGEMIPRLLAVLIIFYITGYFIQKKITAFVEQIREEEAKEGEVIEKEVPAQEEEDAAQEQESQE